MSDVPSSYSFTDSSLSYLLCGNHKGTKNLGHDSSCTCRWHLCVYLEPFEEGFVVLEDVDERILARTDVLGRL